MCCFTGLREALPEAPSGYLGVPWGTPRGTSGGGSEGELRPGPAHALLILLLSTNFATFSGMFAKILTKIEITELSKGVHCVDLGESFQTHI